MLGDGAAGASPGVATLVFWLWSGTNSNSSRQGGVVNRRVAADGPSQRNRRAVAAQPSVHAMLGGDVGDEAAR